VPVRIMHCGAVKFSTMFHRMLASGGHGSVVAFAEIKMMIHVSVKMFGPVEPWSGADEYASGEPFRAVKAIGRAVIRRDFVIAVRTNGRCADFDGNLGVRRMVCGHEERHACDC